MVAGMGGDIQNLYRAGTDWVGSKVISPETRAKLAKTMGDAEIKAKEQYPGMSQAIDASKTGFLPTTEDFEKEATRLLQPCSHQ